MDIGLLGPLHVDHNGSALGPRDRVVLSALAVRPGDVLTPDQLADALWHEQPPASWPKVVQGCVVRLRKALGSDALETTPHGYRLVTERLGFDTHEFERFARLGAEHAGDGLPERAVTAYRRALGLWRGLPFEELQDWDSGRQEAERLLELRRSCEEELVAARIAAGDRAVTADARALVAAEPWRERRWSVLALAQYREGRQADALASIRRASRALQDHLGLDAGAELVALEAAILRQDPGLEDVEQRAAQESCPWKGLAAYDADDRDAFHGREEETAECVARLDRHPMLVLAGPSGCGKSSLLRAGIVPLLRERGRQVLVMVPGQDPAATMATALAGTRGDPVLVVDQFEEVFTLRDDPASARAWLADLATYATERAPVVLAMRADHVAELGVEQSLARLAEAGLHLVSPLTGDRLRAAIEGPARTAGLRLEHGLVDLLLRDSEGEPGALPLLSHALTETWLRRDGRLLTVSGYRDAGGIRGAVARSADRLYEELAPGERAGLRWTLLRLVATSPDGEPFRTRVPSASVVGDPTRERLVEVLARARLVTVSESSVELAHEALARAWPRLRAWLDEDASGQRIWRHLAASADGWDALGRPDSELYRGARLDATDEWLRDAGAALAPVEEAFLVASRQREHSSRLAMAEANRRQAAQNRRLRQLVIGVGALLAVALVAGFAAVDRGRTAQAEGNLARAAEKTSLHESLTSRSLALRSTNRALAALLAVEAYRQQPDALARSALLGTFTWSPGFLGYEHVDANFLNGQVVPHSNQAIVAVDGRNLATLDLRSGRLTHPFPTSGKKALNYSTIRVSGDGRLVAQAVAWDRGQGCGSLEAFKVADASGCTRFSVYDRRTGARVMGPIPGPFGGGDLALNRDGSLLALVGGYDGNLAVYRTRDGHQVGFLRGISRPPGVTVRRDTAAVAFGPDGRTVYLGSMAGPVRRVQVPSMRVTRTYRGPLMSSANFVLLSRHGLLVASGENAIVAYDLATGRRRWTVDLRGGTYEDPCPFLGIADAANTLYCGSYFGQIEERSLTDGGRTGRTLDPQNGSVGDLAVSADGRELLAFAANSGVVSAWRLDGSGPITRLVAAGRVATDGYVGGRLLTSRRAALIGGRVPDGVAVWDPARDVPEARVPGGDAIWVGDGIVSPIWRDDSTDVYDTRTRRRRPSSVLTPHSEGVWRSTDGAVLFVADNLQPQRGGNQSRRYGISAYDTATYHPVGHAVHLRAWGIDSVAMTPDRRRILVAGDLDDGLGTPTYDARSGRLLSKGIHDQSYAVVSASNQVVSASVRGGLTLSDLDTWRPVASFAGARGLVSDLQLSSDGSTLAVTSLDQTVQVYDMKSRIRLGDAITSESPRLQGFLRPDGKALAVNIGSGVAIWRLDAERLVPAACRLAGRSLTRAEWATYLGASVPYRPSCPASTTVPAT